MYVLYVMGGLTGYTCIHHNRQVLTVNIVEYTCMLYLLQGTEPVRVQTYWDSCTAVRTTKTASSTE